MNNRHRTGLLQTTAVMAAVLLFGTTTWMAGSSLTQDRSQMNHSVSDADPAGSAGQKPCQIVTTIFPEYNWVMNLLGDNPASMEVSFLLSNGVDMHSFQPSAEDILKISTCDLFVYVGGLSDAWVEDALKGAANEDMIVVNLLDVLKDNVKEEEIVEGMQEEHDHAEEEGAEEAAEYDEHVWLSLRNASDICGKISEALSGLDPDHRDYYEENFSQYNEKLQNLDASYQEITESAKKKMLLFGDRFPFRYLTDDYGIPYYAAFAGCSAETEASFDTIIFLAQKLDENDLHAVLTIDGSDQSLARTIIQASSEKDRKILMLNSMQGINRKNVEEGASYLSIMEQNLEVLKEAMNE